MKLICCSSVDACFSYSTTIAGQIFEDILSHELTCYNICARDWAAKGTRVLGVDAVIVASFERIHRSKLVLLGVLPLEFERGFNVQGLQIGRSETFKVQGIDGELTPQQKATLVITRTDGSRAEAPLRVRLDTSIEVEYYRHGGIVPFVLRNIFKGEH